MSSRSFFFCYVATILDIWINILTICCPRVLAKREAGVEKAISDVALVTILKRTLVFQGLNCNLRLQPTSALEI